MKFIFMLLVVSAVLRLGTAQVQERTNVEQSSIDQTRDDIDLAQSPEWPNDVSNIKRLRIRNQTGLDGKVRRIHLDTDEEKPGVYVYGLQKKHLQNNGVIERIHLGERRNDDTSRHGRLVEVYGLQKKHLENNGFIERVPLRPVVRRPAPRKGDVKGRRSVSDESGGEIASEAEDMEPQDAKVFRPLFVYRQQVAARQKRKQARELAHGSRQYATNHLYD